MDVGLDAFSAYCECVEQGDRARVCKGRRVSGAARAATRASGRTVVVRVNVLQRESKQGQRRKVRERAREEGGKRDAGSSSSRAVCARRGTGAHLGHDAFREARRVVERRKPALDEQARDRRHGRARKEDGRVAGSLCAVGGGSEGRHERDVDHGREGDEEDDVEEEEERRPASTRWGSTAIWPRRCRTRRGRTTREEAQRRGTGAGNERPVRSRERDGSGGTESRTCGTQAATRGASPSLRTNVERDARISKNVVSKLGDQVTQSQITVACATGAQKCKAKATVWTAQAAREEGGGEHARPARPLALRTAAAHAGMTAECKHGQRRPATASGRPDSRQKGRSKRDRPSQTEGVPAPRQPATRLFSDGTDAQARHTRMRSLLSVSRARRATSRTRSARLLRGAAKSEGLSARERGRRARYRRTRGELLLDRGTACEGMRYK